MLRSRNCKNFALALILKEKPVALEIGAKCEAKYGEKYLGAVALQASEDQPELRRI